MCVCVCVCVCVCAHLCACVCLFLPFLYNTCVYAGGTHGRTAKTQRWTHEDTCTHLGAAGVHVHELPRALRGEGICGESLYAHVVVHAHVHVVLGERAIEGVEVALCVSEARRAPSDVCTRDAPRAAWETSAR